MRPTTSSNSRPWSRSSRRTLAGRREQCRPMRLLLGSQPPGTEAAAYQWLRGHRSATPRPRRGGRKPSRTRQDSHTGHAGQAPTRRLSESVPIAQADGGAHLRADQTGTKVSAGSVVRARQCGAGVEPGVSGPPLLEAGERSRLRGSARNDRARISCRVLVAPWLAQTPPDEKPGPACKKAAVNRGSDDYSDRLLGRSGNGTHPARAGESAASTRRTPADDPQHRQ